KTLTPSLRQRAIGAGGPGEEEAPLLTAPRCPSGPSGHLPIYGEEQSAHRRPADSLRLGNLLLLVLPRVVVRGPVLQQRRGDESDHPARKDVDADHVWILGGQERLARPDLRRDVGRRAPRDDRRQLVAQRSAAV